MSIKKRFPSEVAVIALIEKSAPRISTALTQELGDQLQVFIEAERRFIVGVSYMLLGMILIGMIWVFTDIFSFSISVLFLLAGGICFYYGWKKTRGTTKIMQQFEKVLDEAVYDKLFTLLELDAEITSYIPERVDTKEYRGLKAFWYRGSVSNALEETPVQAEVHGLLEASELVTESKNTISIDDMMRINVFNKQLVLSELDIKHVTGSGKNRRVKKIFHGYFVSFDLGKVLAGKTFISTEGDTVGFGHTSFWSKVTSSGVMKTELEWNEFEDLLHVATNKPSEARYILTPDFMVSLHDWWKDKKQNIRFSFIENRVYMLFPDKKIRIGYSINALSAEEVSEYMKCIAVPLVHVLHVVEDIEYHVR